MEKRKFKVGDKVKITKTTDFLGDDFIGEYCGNIGTIIEISHNGVSGDHLIEFEGIEHGHGANCNCQVVKEDCLGFADNVIYCTCKKCPCCGKLIEEEA